MAAFESFQSFQFFRRLISCDEVNYTETCRKGETRLTNFHEGLTVHEPSSLSRLNANVLWLVV